MKVLASDYDGTLSRGGVISADDRDAIKKFRNAGNRFGIITGRGHSGFLKELKRQKFDCDFIVSNNGAVIYDKEKLVDIVYGDGEILQTLIPFIISVGGLYAAITVDEVHYAAIYGRFAGETEGSGTATENYIRVDHLDMIKRFNQVDCNVGSSIAAAEFAYQVNLRYGKWLNAFNNGDCVDIVPKPASKTYGLERYLEYAGLTKADACTVGDNFNDLGMLLDFGGYAMESGRPEVIEKVGRTCSSIGELIKILSK